MKENIIPDRPRVAYRAPIVSLLVMTMALNIMSLSVPLAAQLIFNRILPSPGTSTLGFVVLGVVILALLEAIVRLARSYILLDASRISTTEITRNLMRRLVTSNFNAGARGAARSLDYFTRIAQVAEKESGKLLVAVAELLFLPVILTIIFLISPIIGLLITACLFGGFVITLRGANTLRRNAVLLNRLAERRYRFLLSILTAIHPLKALSIEEFLLRRYEHIQTGIARTSMKASEASNRLLNGVLVTNQAIMMTTLVFGAYAIQNGEITLGALSAIVLLGGRLIGPLQRAIFIFVQARDLCEAEDVVNEVMSYTPTRPATVELDVENTGNLCLRDVAFQAGVGGAEQSFANITLDITPGEMLAISGSSQAGCTKLLRIMAGIERPLDGDIILNGVSIADYPADQLNRMVGYASGEATMFHGTIMENITRFGEVPIEDALSVAALMDLQSALNELPRGLDTEMTGSINENIPTSLCQQLAILRSLAHRPRIILLDNVDRGLDRQSYGRLQRFVAAIQGQASIVMVSDDRNLTAGAQSKIELHPSGLRVDMSAHQRDLPTYRSLKL